MAALGFQRLARQYAMMFSVFCKASCAVVATFVCTLLHASGSSVTGPVVSSAPAQSSQQSRIAAQYAALPMRFESNVGQTDQRVNFLARGNAYTLFLTATESVMVFGKRAGSGDSVAQSAAVVRIGFAGANPKSRVEGLSALPGLTNYFIGNDASKWRTDIVSFAKVRYYDVYPGIDVVYYGNQRDVEYDFIVSPGADTKAIALNVQGAKSLSVNGAGELVMKMAEGELRQKAPVLYQEGPAGMELISGSYQVRGKQVSFQVGAYDRARPLIIDPILVYSSFLGGSGFDQATAIHVGATGDAYITGITNSTNFPILGTPSSTLGGGQDIFVTKMSLAGNTLTYSTYIGGLGTDVANDIVVSGAGPVYITGSTNSINYPVVTPTIAAQVGGTDAFLTKLSAAGNAIVYSTYWGSTGFEEGTAVTVDPADNAYIAGNTSAPDFPTQTPFQAALAGGMDAFMTKFSVAGNSIVYSTYLGGAGDDRAFDMEVADDAAVFVVGSSTSANFPTTSSSLQPALAGGRDAFLTHFSLAGNTLLYSTYLGGSADDEAFAITIDAPMNAYLTGRTGSTNFPTVTPLQPFFRGGANDAFIAKINPPGTALVFSTYLGGAGNDQGQGIAIDTARNVFVTGGTSSNNFPTINAFQTTLSGAADAFVTKLSTSGLLPIYSTYLGGMAADEGQAIGVDLIGSAYVTGFTESLNFPTVSPFQAVFGAVRDAFITKLIDGNGVDLIFADGFEGSN